MTGSPLSFAAVRMGLFVRHPELIFNYGKMHCKHLKKCQFLWASAREIYNLKQAVEAGADIITLSPELLKKLPLRGKNLQEYSIETVKQFFEDSKGIEF